MSEVTRSIVLFPGAGSFGGEFQPLVNALRPAAWLVRYPGRYGKGFGVPAATFDAVVRACTEQITRRAIARPVLFGHSFGAYVAYAAALRLQEAGVQVAALVAAGAAAPALLTVSERAVGTLPEAAAYLDGVDPGVLADAPSDEWRKIVTETLVHDLRLLRQFGAAPAGSLRCPVVAVRGDADPLTSDATAGAWRKTTDGTFALRVFPGGHSDVLRSAACTSFLHATLDGFGQADVLPTRTDP